MAQRRGGCFFFLLVIFIGAAMVVEDEAPSNNWQANPRRPDLAQGHGAPLPGVEPVPESQIFPATLPEFGIADRGRPQDSQGTGFAVSPDGIWLTAEHVVTGCDRVGLATGPNSAERVGQIFESRVSDAAAIAGGARTATTLALSPVMPREGDDGYHMGFPSGQPAVVHSRFMGRGNAVHPGRSEPVLAWAEIERFPDFEHGLGGISGGPTLDVRGRVIGINSAAGERRGRVLTTVPEAASGLLQAARLQSVSQPPGPIANAAAAVARFQNLIVSGAIRQVYCDVNE
ncbi:S1 family peptidase [Sphingobium boeckii]|uniref:S1-C subfamily serine protease n=1 Tax=Sphingobium boeckii TaxID=1082345 RepID=A0A7W9AFM6_9SPHN|nr:serine protease [Sphingobium boeckii]MBB5684626.1 S1-C subfamily serine protease [Sphingobium boeckii]